MPQMLDRIAHREVPSLLWRMTLARVFPIELVLLFGRRGPSMAVAAGGPTADGDRRPPERLLVGASTCQAVFPSAFEVLLDPLIKIEGDLRVPYPPSLPGDRNGSLVVFQTQQRLTREAV